MGANIDGRDLASVVIEDSLKEQAASTEIFRTTGTKEKHWNQRKVMGILCVWIVLIYLGSMILTTVLVQQVYEDSFETNVSTIQEFVCANAGENLIGNVNALSDISLVKRSPQLFSAAIYDAQGKLVAKTTPSLVFALDDGQVFYCSLESYMDDSQIQELFDYAYGTSESYRVEAKIAKKTGILHSLRFIATWTGQNNTVWQWDNSEPGLNKEETVNYSKKIPVRQVLSIPCNQDIGAYEKWSNNEFLQGFKSELDKEESDETFSLSKSKVEKITKVTRVNEDGENETCFVAIRSVGNTWLAAIKLMVSVYVVGLILAIAFAFYWRAWINRRK